MYSRYTLFLLLFLITEVKVFCQSTSSPYSMFAEGQIESPGTGTNHALGGSGIAFKSRYSLNTLNPASYSGIDSLSFIFEAGLFWKYTQYSSGSESQSRYDANLRYLAMGCRFTSWWKTGFGFMPYSSVGYSINTIDYVQGELSAYQKIYEGSGGINQFYWGHSFSPLKNLALGINISYYLGTIEHNETGATTDGSLTYAISKVSNVHDIALDYGIQYSLCHKDLRFTLGAVYSDVTYLSTSNEVSIDFESESVSLDETEEEYIIPRKYGLGLAFEKGENLRIGFDYERKEWGNLNTFQNPLLDTRDGERFSAGIEYTPYRGFKDEGWKKMSFRIGGCLNQTYMIIDETPLDAYSLVLGLGIPLRKELTMINFSVEGGRYGTTSKALFMENYFLLHLNFTLHDKWFMKHAIQ